jgi:hypothetical protein
MKKKSQEMLYWKIKAVCSERSTNHVRALCRQSVEFLNVKLEGA